MVDTALIFPVACCAAVVLGVGYKINSYFAEKKRVAEVQRTGIGRGAAGFMTGSKRVALPLHIAARIKMGEEVSAEEITEALQLQKEQEEREERRRKEAEEAEAAGRKPIPESVDQDWLPAGAITPNKGAGRRRKK